MVVKRLILDGKMNVEQQIDKCSHKHNVLRF